MIDVFQGKRRLGERLFGLILAILLECCELEIGVNSWAPKIWGQFLHIDCFGMCSCAAVREEIRKYERPPVPYI